MRSPDFLTGLLAVALATGSTIPIVPASAQSNQLRGINPSGTAQMPSARDQLNQNLDRQRTRFSNQRQIDSTTRLNRTNQINRNNTRTDPAATCPGANRACRD